MISPMFPRSASVGSRRYSFHAEHLRDGRSKGPRPPRSRRMAVAADFNTWGSGEVFSKDLERRNLVSRSLCSRVLRKKWWLDETLNEAFRPEQIPPPHGPHTAEGAQCPSFVSMAPVGRSACLDAPGGGGGRVCVWRRAGRRGGTSLKETGWWWWEAEGAEAPRLPQVHAKHFTLPIFLSLILFFVFTVR